MVVAIASKSEQAEPANTTSITIAKPSGTVDGDLLVAIIAKDHNVSFGPPDGSWNVGQNAGRGTAGVRFVFHWKIASGEGTDWTWTGDNEEWYGVVLRITGHDPTTPMNISDVADGSDAAPISPTITTDIDGCLIIACFGVDDDDTPYSVDAALAEEWNAVSSTGAGTCGTAGGIETQGTFGATGTYTHSVNATEEWVAFTIAIAPAAGAVEITPGAGAISAAGEAAIARVNTFLTVDAGSMTAVGYQPTVDVTLPITPDAGSLVVAGQTPALEKEDFVTPAAGSLAVAGYQPTVTQSGGVDTPLTPDAGSLTAAGYQPTVNVIRWITPAAGSLAIVGAEPTVKIDYYLTPAAGSLVGSGYQPTVNVIRWITPDAGSLTVTGEAPDLRENFNLIPGTGSLTISGAAPTIEKEDYVTPDTGSLVIAGYQPTVQQALNEVTPSAGSLVATGLAPDIRIEPPYHAVFNQKYGGAKAVTYGNKSKTVIYGNKAKEIKQ